MRIILVSILTLTLLQVGCGSKNGAKSGAVPNSSDPQVNSVSITTQDTSAGQSQPLSRVPVAATPPQPAEINSSPADIKVLHSADTGKTIKTFDLPLEEITVEIKKDNSSDEIKYLMEFKTKMPTLKDQPKVTLTGLIDLAGQFRLSPTEENSDYSIAGVGECFTTETFETDQAQANRCSSLYIDVYVKDHENYLYKQVKVQKITYLSEEKPTPTPESKEKSSEKPVVKPVTKPAVKPKLVKISPPADEDTEPDCTKAVSDKDRSALCTDPGRFEGRDLSLEELFPKSQQEKLPALPSIVPSLPRIPPVKIKESTKPSVTISQTRSSHLQSFYDYNTGHLENATELIEDRNVFYKNRIDLDTNFGADSLVNFVKAFVIEHTINTSQKEMVSTLAKKTGGRVKGQVSHHNGLEVDLGYPSNIEDENMFVSVVPGLTKAPHQTGKLNMKAFRANLKWIKENADPVRIFVHPAIIKWTCDDAKKTGDLERDKDILDLLTPESRHFHVMHVRLRCQKADSLCQNEKAAIIYGGCRYSKEKSLEKEIL